MPVAHHYLHGSVGAGGGGVRAGERKGEQMFSQANDCANAHVDPPLSACVRMGSSRAAAPMSASVGSPTSPSSDAKRWPVRGRAAAKWRRRAYRSCRHYGTQGIIASLHRSVQYVRLSRGAKAYRTQSYCTFPPASGVLACLSAMACSRKRNCACSSVPSPKAPSRA